MSKDHILIEKAHKYIVNNLNAENKLCDYNIEKGYWMIKEKNEPMVTSNYAQKLITKKEDIETGEDQKGE